MIASHLKKGHEFNCMNVKDGSALITVIVPVYNCEHYLGHCMESVLTQNYRNLDIILVDDGSTDSSSDMCEMYVKKDSRVSVIHKENGGLSSARNAGLKKAKGEYIAFVDSDDYVKTEYLSTLYSYLVHDKTDLVICRVKKVFSEQDYRESIGSRYEHLVYDHDTAVKNMVGMRMPIYAPGKLYKAEYAKRITFPEGRLYEDINYNWQYQAMINKVTYLSCDPYFYRQRKGSIVNQKFKHQRMDQLYFSEDIYNEVCLKNELELKCAAMMRCFFAAADNISLIDDFKCDDWRYLCAALMKYGEGCFKNPFFSKAMKLLFVSALINPRITHWIGRLYKSVH